MNIYYIYLSFIMIFALLTAIFLIAWSALISVRIYVGRPKNNRLGRDDNAHVSIAASDPLRQLANQTGGLNRDENTVAKIMFTADIFKLSGMGIIVYCPTGVLLSNQVGGYMCAHPRLEGFYLPLVAADSQMIASLREHFFHGPKWQGDCYNGIDVETADFIDGLFEQDPYSRGLKVDRNRLDGCMEAWIHVTFDETAFASGNAAILTPPTQGTGVVTWPNSD